MTFLCILAACGRGASAEPPYSNPHSAPSVLVSSLVDCLSPGHDYDLSNESPPVPVFLSADRSCGPGRLQAVGAEITPNVSGADAYQLCCRSGGLPNRVMTEELAYYSAPTPATIPAECVPAPTKRLPPQCTFEPAQPWYHHTLVWFFVWKADCPPTFGPAVVKPNPPAACVWFTLIDATTGELGMLTAG